MAKFSGVIVTTAALLSLIAPTVDVSAQANLNGRVAAAIDTVEGACASDIPKYCGQVSRGEGRVLLCMQAHDDQLSRGCQFALYRASRNLDRALSRVERIADACWTDIETQCADADGIAQCVIGKASSVSQACQAV